MSGDLTPEHDLLDLLAEQTAPAFPRATRDFLDFHAANPGVLDLLVDAARQYRRQTGHAECGVSLLYGRARWVSVVRTHAEDFRLNDHHQPFYARLMAHPSVAPDLDGMFVVRASVADEMLPEWTAEAVRAWRAAA